MEAPDYRGVAFPAIVWPEDGAQVSATEVLPGRWGFFFFPVFMMFKERTATYLSFLDALKRKNPGISLSSYIFNHEISPYHRSPQKYNTTYSLSEQQLDEHHLVDDGPRFRLFDRLAVRNLPSLIVVDPSGIIRYHAVYSGRETEQAVRQIIEAD
jgi:hypothetical protein